MSATQEQPQPQVVPGDVIQQPTSKAIVAGAPTDLPLRCRVGWHRWSKWGQPVGLLARQWNVILGQYNEPSVIQVQASQCSDCDAFRQREAK